MSKKTIKEFAIMIAGALVLGLGISFVVSGDLGSDSMTTFEQGISRSLNIELPLATLSANMLFIVLLFLTDRKRVSLATVLCPLFISLGIKLSSYVVPQAESIYLRIAFLLVGIVIVGMGIGIGAQNNTGSNPYDGFIISASEKLKIDYRWARPLMDALMLVIGILLKGSWGIGTVISTLTMGIVAQYFINLFKKVIK